jgi:MarR family transcriptional regulator for hemolysin
MNELVHPPDGTELYIERRVLTASRAIRAAFDARFGELNLNMTEGALLTTLRRFGPLNQRELSDLLFVGRAAAGQFIDRLETRGLVQRDADPVDRRVWKISTTEAGTALSIQAFDAYFQTAADLIAGLNLADRHLLADLLLAVQENAEQISGSGE